MSASSISNRTSGVPSRGGNTSLGNSHHLPQLLGGSSTGIFSDGSAVGQASARASRDSASLRRDRKSPSRPPGAFQAHHYWLLAAPLQQPAWVARTWT